MGMEVALLVMASTAAAVGKANAESQAASAQNKALDLQAKQQQLQYEQKTLANYDAMQKVLESQIAQMTVSGTAFSSPSFNAIQRNTLNIGAKEAKNLSLENSLVQQNIAFEKQNVRRTLQAQLFGDALNLGLAGLNLYSGMPTKGK